MLKQKKGTFSDENALFTIVANKNDTFHITSIGYTSKIIAVKSKHLNKTSKNTITLSKKVNVLAEIVIEQNKLVGTLQIDIKKTPTHYKNKIVNKIVEDLKKMDTYKISKMGTNLNETHLTKSTKIRLPNNRFEGFGITTSTSSGSEKLKC
ncbi:hypothetical protein [Polaribacter tangerinus]|uniref:hypothetical protein n=1 Tax=Polaribacter tangerinus TaxID=1920034 RepID=UPI000B4B8227|nr:hypothetical protein [Polaribacter tangerinus]